MQRETCGVFVTSGPTLAGAGRRRARYGKKRLE